MIPFFNFNPDPHAILTPNNRRQWMTFSIMTHIVCVFNLFSFRSECFEIHTKDRQVIFSRKEFLKFINIFRKDNCNIIIIKTKHEKRILNYRAKPRPLIINFI